MTAVAPPPEHSQRLKVWASYAGVWPKLAVGFGVLAGILLIAQAWWLASILNAVLFEHAKLADLLNFLLTCRFYLGN
jgi:ATP-binding cassette subfamily C protein CydD